MADHSRYCHIGKAGAPGECGHPGLDGARPRQGGRAPGRDAAVDDQDVDCGEVGVGERLLGESAIDVRLSSLAVPRQFRPGTLAKPLAGCTSEYDKGGPRRVDFP